MKVIQTNAKTFFTRSVGVAEHFGFKNLDDIQTSGKKRTSALNLSQHKGSDGHYDQHALSNVLREYTQGSELQKKQPLLFYTPSLVSKSRASKEWVSALTLSAVGMNDPLMEIMVVKGATCVLEELGMKNYTVRVNSLGDADSTARFVREVTPLLRQRSGEFSQRMSEMLRDKPEKVIAKLYEEKHPLVADLPSPLDFLTTPSRKHFKELLELLEKSGIPFELDDRIYGDHAMYSHSVFEIVENSDDPEKEKEVLARGGRYDALTKKYVRSAVPAVGVVLAFNTKDSGGKIRRPSKKLPSACLILVGKEARIKSIAIIETFRREKIPIEQCLQYERFSEQLEYAQEHNTKYIVIMGQREAQEGVAIVRNSLDRSQETVSISGLPAYLRATA